VSITGVTASGPGTTTIIMIMMIIMPVTVMKLNDLLA
jgi:hypothetical protein